MTLVDDRILEFLRETGPASPSKIHEDGRVNFSRPYINQRCGKLAEHSLVENLGNGVYSITSRGEEYLDGEVNLQDK